MRNRQGKKMKNIFTMISVAMSMVFLNDHRHHIRQQAHLYPRVMVQGPWDIRVSDDMFTERSLKK